MQPQAPPSRALHWPRSAARTHRRARLAPALAVALALPGAPGLGCTHAARERFEGTRPAEALVEVLPPDAQVALDGRRLGAGDQAVPVPASDAAPHVVEVSAPGFVPERREVPPGGLAGTRVGVALRPEGFAAPLDLDAADGLLAATLFLLRTGRAPEAIPYARRAAALEPRLPIAHRLLGEVLAAAGEPRAAAESLRDYLRLAPGAPDADAVAARRAQLLERADGR